MYNVPEDMNMRMDKIAVSVLSCALLVALTGTSLPFAGRVSCDEREYLIPAVPEDKSEDAMSGGSRAATVQDIYFSEEDLISSEQRIAEAKDSDDLIAATCDGASFASTITRKKKTVRTEKPKTDEDQDPEGGNSMGSSFKKEDLAAKSRETAHIRDKYMSLHRGMDISQFNGDIDWKKVVDSGIEAVIIRVGGRYGASGEIYNDKRRDENIKGALNAGLAVGVYFYSQALTEEEGIEEAKFCIDAVKGYELTLPIIIDYEWEPGYRLANGGTKEQRTAVVNAFCKTATKAGYRAGIYASDYCFKDYLIPEKIYNNYYIWLAHWTSAELPGIAYYGPFDGWQYSAVGSVPGISGDVDLDYFYWIDKFFVNYYIDDDLKYDSTAITLGVKTRTKTAAELGIESEDSSLFAGWHVFRERDNCWADYKLTDETKKTVWVEPDSKGMLPEGYDYKIYPDGVMISNTSKGGNVNFYAAWTSDGYKIRYHSGKATAAVTTSVYWGQQTQTLSYEECGFSKKGYEFAGWKVRRDLDGKWAVYANEDETRTTRWVTKVDGELPEGFSYKYYRNKVSVSNSAKTGYVDFYAHWEKKSD